MSYCHVLDTFVKAEALSFGWNNFSRFPKFWQPMYSQKNSPTSFFSDIMSCLSFPAALELVDQGPQLVSLNMLINGLCSSTNLSLTKSSNCNLAILHAP